MTGSLARGAALALASVLAVTMLMACSGPGATTAPTVAGATPSIEQKLAIVNGDPGSATEFGQLLDRVQAGTAICRPEPDRLHVADVLVASWQVAEKPGTLLEWARAGVSVCGTEPRR